MVRKTIQRPLYGLAALLLLASSAVTLFNTGSAHAYGQVSERQIKLSSSALGAASTSYFVSFKPATTATVKSIAVDFCQNDPILNDSCTGTVGTNTPTLTAATVDTTTALAGNIGAGWAITLTNSNRTFTIANASGVAMTAGTAYYFTINLVTNPTDNDTITAGNQPGTFYARVLTFPNDAATNYAGGYLDTNLATNVPTDAGGIALSTSSQITVTSKVQERLSFCVYTGINCAAGGSAVTLGDTNGVLDTTGPFVDINTKYDVATNASLGAAIRLKGDTLKSGSFDIAPIGAGASASVLGTEQFGLCNYQSTGAGLTPSAPYNNANCSTATQTAGTASTGGVGTAQFAFDLANINTTYGQVIANKTAGATSVGTLAFLGNISNTTEAGIYTTALTFIATGIY